MTIVFTNGVFDIIHGGHIKLLKLARSYGDLLVVAINTDESAARLKGPTRPIMKLESRKAILESLSFVHNVITFEEDTPERLIKVIRPNVLVKGPEAANAEIPGADYVRSYGGKVIIPKLRVEESTSLIIKKVMSEENQYPSPKQLELYVNGKNVDPIDYSLRFCREFGETKPVLYNIGKRVVNSWDMNFIHSQPADKNGRSA